VLTPVDTSDSAEFLRMNLTATDTSITGDFLVSLCPENTVAAAEVCGGGTCDDDNPCSIDGCGATPCSAPGSSCTNMGINGGSCDDGNACTGADHCNAGTCVAFPVPCNDNDPCTNDACDPGVGGCVFTPNSNTCNDGTLCTTSDTCVDGTCVGGPALECAPCQQCRPLAGCVTVPRTGCRQPVTPSKSKIVLRDSTDDARDKVQWTWNQGQATTAAELGDPVGSADYAFCVYDGPPATPRLLLSSVAPSGGTCEDGSSCWIAKGTPPGSKGYVYKDRELLLPDGLKSVKLMPGIAGKAKAKAKGQGQLLALPSPMNVTLPVVVQLQGEHGTCFETTYTAAKVDREEAFIATGSP
jgi:hypothetical protein